MKISEQVFVGWKNLRVEVTSKKNEKNKNYFTAPLYTQILHHVYERLQE
jgi:hypothetical protein